MLKVIPLEEAREATDHVEAHIKKVRRRRARATEHVKGARRIGAIWEAARDSPDPVR